MENVGGWLLGHEKRHRIGHSALRPGVFDHHTIAARTVEEPAPGRDSNPHEGNPHRILSPVSFVWEPGVPKVPVMYPN